ncbi:MAG: 5-methylthioadenosine/S-adenosylhomocysteine deaminase [Actinomycetota bacterium]|nr:5-methylthioadenosine/S-adenosylhomocysteine deaminase [Actinomycetota bacterium]
MILLDADDPSVFPFNNPAGTIVAAGHRGLVDTVLVAGRVVKRGGRLLDVDLPTLRRGLVGSRDRIAAAAGVQLDGTWHPSTGSG